MWCYPFSNFGSYLRNEYDQHNSEGQETSGHPIETGRFLALRFLVSFCGKLILQRLVAVISGVGQGLTVSNQLSKNGLVGFVVDITVEAVLAGCGNTLSRFAPRN